MSVGRLFILRPLFRVNQGWSVLAKGVCRALCSTSNATQATSISSLPPSGSLYTVDAADVTTLNLPRNLPSHYARQLETLGECAWMCRRPLIEVVNCLEAVRPQLPAFRVVLWGKFGTGKSITLHQTTHYALHQSWVVLYVRSGVITIHMSTRRPGRIDTPQHAQAVLVDFKTRNAKLWSTLGELRTEREYEWTKVDRTSAGSALTDVVDMGIAAPFVASDCVGVLLRELKRHASDGRIRVLIALDDANSLYGRTNVLRADKTFAKAGDLTLVEHFRALLKSDWTNGAVVLVADKKELSDATDKFAVMRHTPLELFGEEGFDALDPFIPVEVAGYTPEEATALHAYYCEKKWIATEKGRSDDGRLQMMHLSAFNPYIFERMCAFL